MNALSLYCRDKSELFERMRKEIAESLSSKSGAFLKQLAQEFDLTEKDVTCLKAGEMTVDFALFDRLKGALDISLQKVLRSPTFTRAARTFWEKQCRSESPMFFAAPIQEVRTGDRKQELSDEERKRIELDLYVRLRAIDELAWNK